MTRDPNRKVLKLGVSQRDLERFVQAHQELGTVTLSSTLGELLDAYEQHRDRITSNSSRGF